MLSVKLIDKSFIGCGPSCGTGQTGIAPLKMQWYVGPEQRPITVFTDGCLNEVDHFTNTIKIAWLIEPKSVSPSIYNWIRSNIHKFDYILTHDRTLIESNPKFVFCPLGGHWIKKEDHGSAVKTKNVSIIASWKRQTDGHQLRHQIIQRYHSRLDGIYGNGYAPIKEKTIGLKDFRYSISIENSKYDYWFSEKLIDCFMSWTIPIYWGLPSVASFFNPKGIIVINSIDDVEQALNIATPKYFTEVIDAVKENYQISCEKYATPEDYMYDNLLRRLI